MDKGIDLSKISIDDLEFDTRTYCCLKRSGISTLKDLSSLTREELYKIRNLGIKSTGKVIEVLEKYHIEMIDRNETENSIDENKYNTNKNISQVTDGNKDELLTPFAKGLMYAKEYYKENGVWDVDYETVYRDYNLGAWWSRTRYSIMLGSFRHFQVSDLIESGIDFGVTPLHYEQWCEMVRRWFEEKGELPLENDMQGEYFIGKWLRHNEKEYEYWYSKNKDNQCENASPNVFAYNKSDIVWERMYDKFSEAWNCAKKDMLLEENGYSRSLYFWGLRQIEKRDELELWKKNKLNQIGMLWEPEMYDMIFSPWILQFNLFKKLYVANDRQLSEECNMASLRKFNWAKSEMNSQIDEWKIKKFKSIGIDNLYELEEIIIKKRDLIQRAVEKNKMQQLNERRLKGDLEAIVSVKVFGKQVDYVRSDVVTSIYDCDYYEVQLQVCSTFDENEFREYINLNKQRFIYCGKKAIAEKRSKRGIIPYLPNLKVDKMVYGLKSHMITIMFSIQKK